MMGMICWDNETWEYVLQIIPRIGKTTEITVEGFEEEFNFNGFNPLELNMRDFDKWRPIDTSVKIAIWFPYIYLQILYDIDKGIESFKDIKQAMKKYDVDEFLAKAYYKESYTLLSDLIGSMSNGKGYAGGKVLNVLGEFKLNKMYVK